MLLSEGGVIKCLMAASKPKGSSTNPAFGIFSKEICCRCGRTHASMTPAWKYLPADYTGSLCRLNITGPNHFQVLILLIFN